MRTRKEILNDFVAQKTSPAQQLLILESILDIRDALTKEEDWWIGHKVNCPRTTGQKDINDMCNCSTTPSIPEKLELQFLQGVPIVASNSALHKKINEIIDYLTKTNQK